MRKDREKEILNISERLWLKKRRDRGKKGLQGQLGIGWLVIWCYPIPSGDGGSVGDPVGRFIGDFSNPGGSGM